MPYNPVGKVIGIHTAYRCALKVGVVSPYDWSFPGGVREHILYLSRHLRALGHDVKILTPATDELESYEEDYIYPLGATTPVPINGSVARISLAPALAKKVQAILDHEKFDIIHLHEPLAPALPLTVLRYSQSINVGTFHASAKASFTSTSELVYMSAKPILYKSFQKLDGLIAVSPAAYNFVNRHFPGVYEIIPNGVDLARFNTDVQPLFEYKDQKINILFVGRLEKRKGLRYLIHSIPKIREVHPNTRFIIVGEGSLRNRYERYVADNGWEDVIFTGYVDDTILPRYYATCDIFCSPSIGSESQGIVLLQALASGKPIIASSIDGHLNVIRDRVEGLFVPPASSNDLAKAINILLSSPEMRARMGRWASKSAAKFSWDKVAGEISNYYESLLSGNHIHTTITTSANSSPEFMSSSTGIVV